jgi:hypothetical protein
MYERGDTFIPNPYKYTESHFVEWIDELQSVKEEPLARFLIKQLNYYIEQKKIGAFK